MELKMWLLKNKLTITEFAIMIGYNKNHVGSVSTGYIRAGKGLAYAIEMATGGQVKAKSLMEKQK